MYHSKIICIIANAACQDEHVSDLVNECPRLVELDVSDATLLTPLSLQSIIQRLPRLESLSTSRYPPPNKIFFYLFQVDTIFGLSSIFWSNCSWESDSFNMIRLICRSPGNYVVRTTKGDWGFCARPQLFVEKPLLFLLILDSEAFQNIKKNTQSFFMCSFLSRVYRM